MNSLFNKYKSPCGAEGVAKNEIPAGAWKTK